MRTFVDCETIRNPDRSEVARIAATLSAPKTHKKPETIAEWHRLEAPLLAEQKWAEQSFDPAAGQLVCISCARDDDSEPVVHLRRQGESEAQLLGDFYATILRWLDEAGVTGADGHRWPSDSPWFIGHNLAFDLHWLRARSWVLGVRPPFKLPASDARPGKDYGDTMHLWAGFKDRISLDTLCKALGVPTPKGECGGSMVFDLWDTEQYDKLQRYAAADVAATRSCWRRLNWEAAA